MTASGTGATERRPAVVALDVIETLFSLESLRPKLEAIGLPSVYREPIRIDGAAESRELAECSDCCFSFWPF